MTSVAAAIPIGMSRPNVSNASAAVIVLPAGRGRARAPGCPGAPA